MIQFPFKLIQYGKYNSSVKFFKFTSLIILYNNDFILKAKLRLKEINIEKKINIIHLRLEEDGIKHWSKINIKNDIEWTDEMDKYSRNKSVIELKNLLREKGLKVSGTKKELVNRIIANSYS